MKTIRIETGINVHPRNWKFFLGDTNIAAYVNRFTIDLTEPGPPKVTVTLIANTIEIPDEINGVVTFDVADWGRK